MWHSVKCAFVIFIQFRYDISILYVFVTTSQFYVYSLYERVSFVESIINK